MAVASWETGCWNGYAESGSREFKSQVEKANSRFCTPRMNEILSPFPRFKLQADRRRGYFEIPICDMLYTPMSQLHLDTHTPVCDK